jgi:rubredoxin
MRYSGGGPFPIFVLLFFFLLVGIFGGNKGGYTLKNRIKDHLRRSLTFYCPNCHEKKVFTKYYGLLTLILILATKGAWILTLPFYRKRCPVCKLSEKKAYLRGPGEY